MSATQDSGLDLVLTRVVDVPRDLIWKVWSTPEHLMKWWAPKPVETIACEMEMRPGGRFHTVMRTPDGTLYPTEGTFLEIAEGERIVFTDALTAGWRPAEKPFFTAIITMEDVPEGTRYTARAIHRSAAERKTHEDMGFHDGWATALSQLVALAHELEVKA